MWCFWAAFCLLEKNTMSNVPLINVKFHPGLVRAYGRVSLFNWTLSWIKRQCQKSCVLSTFIPLKTHHVHLQLLHLSIVLLFLFLFLRLFKMLLQQNACQDNTTQEPFLALLHVTWPVGTETTALTVRNFPRWPTGYCRLFFVPQKKGHLKLCG